MVTEGAKSLRSVRYGYETTAGTAVAATSYLHAFGTLEDQRETVFPNYDLSMLPGTTLSYVPKHQAALALESAPASFEEICAVFNCGIAQDTAGTQDGTAGSGYVYTFTAGTTAATTIQTLTIETGDNVQAEETAYCFVTDFNLAGVAGEGLMISSNWLGRAVSTCSITTAATIKVVEEILASKGVLSIDAVGGTMGNTAVTSTIKGIDLKYNTGLIPLFSLDGNIYFTEIVQAQPAVTLDVTFLHETQSVAQIAAWKAETPKQLEIEWLGSALTTAGGASGGAYTYSTLNLAMSGMWESFTKIDEEDGLDVVTGTFKALYDATSANFFVATVVHEDSDLTD